MRVPEMVKNGFKSAFAYCGPLLIRLMSVVLVALEELKPLYTSAR
jgi:hypothetical protein